MECIPLKFYKPHNRSKGQTINIILVSLIFVYEALQHIYNGFVGGFWQAIALRAIDHRYVMFDDECIYKLFDFLVYKLHALIQDYFNSTSKLDNNTFIKKIGNDLGDISFQCTCFEQFGDIINFHEYIFIFLLYKKFTRSNKIQPLMSTWSKQ